MTMSLSYDDWKIRSGGKRKSRVQHSTEDFESLDILRIMSPDRKRAKVENNNTKKLNEEGGTKLDLKEMGVGVLPGSDIEEEASDDEINNQVSPDRSDESSVVDSPSPSSIKHSDSVMITPPEQLLSYKFRRSIKNICKRDHFEQLSDEIILMILSWLPQKNLTQCAKVCQRWRRISYDESLWQRMDLTGSVLHTDQAAYVLQRNPIILRMAQAEVVSPLFTEMSTSMEDFVCQVQFLDLSMALISSTDLASLLGKCQRLKKLSLEHCTTDTAVCSSIACNPDLEVLNLSQCYSITASGLEDILINCSELTELNLAWTSLDNQCIDIVCKLVNENIQKLDLSGGLKRMKDSHVKELVTRCTCLTELNLSDCTELTDNCIEPILKHLCDIEELSFSRCYSINPLKYLKLSTLSSLKYLNIFGLMHDTQYTSFKEGLSQISLNEHEFSRIARPTVGLRRTSIWGLRVREI